ncbi:MAG: hypothetical protein EXS46_02400 [Candidatus Taylorbacteria bacterium]|nr:hypothetical protein [Candidatus Taylorbacteria bacterium]
MRTITVTDNLDRTVNQVDADGIAIVSELLNLVGFPSAQLSIYNITVTDNSGITNSATGDTKLNESIASITVDYKGSMPK